MSKAAKVWDWAVKIAFVVAVLGLGAMFIGLAIYGLFLEPGAWSAPKQTVAELTPVELFATIVIAIVAVRLPALIQRDQPLETRGEKAMMAIYCYGGLALCLLAVIGAVGTG